jgi:hypothetical protein
MEIIKGHLGKSSASDQKAPIWLKSCSVEHCVIPNHYDYLFFGVEKHKNTTLKNHIKKEDSILDYRGFQLNWKFPGFFLVLFFNRNG